MLWLCLRMCNESNILIMSRKINISGLEFAYNEDKCLTDIVLADKGVDYYLERDLRNERIETENLRKELKELRMTICRNYWQFVRNSLNIEINL